MVESTDEGLEESGCEVTEVNEKEIDWIDESIDNWLHEAGTEFHEDAPYWGHESDTGPRNRRRLRPAAAPSGAGRQFPMHREKRNEQ